MIQTAFTGSKKRGSTLWQSGTGRAKAVKCFRSWKMLIKKAPARVKWQGIGCLKFIFLQNRRIRIRMIFCLPASAWSLLQHMPDIFLVYICLPLWRRIFHTWIQPFFLSLNNLFLEMVRCMNNNYCHAIDCFIQMHIMTPAKVFSGVAKNNKHGI